MANGKFVFTTRLVCGLIIVGILCFTSVQADRFDNVNVHTWKIDSDSNFFPEVDDPRVSVEWLKSRPSFGIAFSGGGTRSSSATLGQLRALKKLGWIDQARYISANSGGSWTVLPFVYLPTNIEEDHFLGEYVPPQKINDEALTPNTDRQSMSAAIYNSNIGDKIFALRKGDEAYSTIIGEIFLEPFGLQVDRKKLFTFHDKALTSVLGKNKNLKREDFYLVNEKRKIPYPIIVGSLSIPVNDKSSKSELFLIEATPLYIGIRNEFRVSAIDGKESVDLLVGGGYVESFGYDSYEPESAISNTGLWKVQLEGMLDRGDPTTNERYRFTLSDVIGMSGSAPAITLENRGIHEEVFPEFRYWAIDRKKILADDGLRDKAMELTHGDGGDIDNLALMPLLSRKVENILVFINTRIEFPESVDCSNITKEIMVDDLISLFRPVGELKHNVVIDDKNKLKMLCQEFSKRKNNQLESQPLVYCDEYVIKDNFRQGVRGENYRPSICWVYLDRVEKWIGKLAQGNGENPITKDLRKAEGDFETFPHYKTFNQQKDKVIDLKQEQVHALSNLTAWTVIASKDYLAKQLAGASLPADGVSTE